MRNSTIILNGRGANVAGAKINPGLKPADASIVWKRKWHIAKELYAASIAKIASGIIQAELKANNGVGLTNLYLPNSIAIIAFEGCKALAAGGEKKLDEVLVKYYTYKSVDPKYVPFIKTELTNFCKLVYDVQINKRGIFVKKNRELTYNYFSVPAGIELKNGQFVNFADGRSAEGITLPEFRTFNGTLKTIVKYEGTRRCYMAKKLGMNKGYNRIFDSVNTQLWDACPAEDVDLRVFA